MYKQFGVTGSGEIGPLEIPNPTALHARHGHCLALAYSCPAHNTLEALAQIAWATRLTNYNLCHSATPVAPQKSPWETAGVQEPLTNQPAADPQQHQIHPRTPRLCRLFNPVELFCSAWLAECSLGPSCCPQGCCCALCVA